MSRLGIVACVGMLLAAAPALAAADLSSAHHRSPAPPFTARVSLVVDGDTLVVTREPSHRVRIRLFGIDCPEGEQPYGDRARAELAKWVSGREVRVEPTGRDDWGRTVARVFVGDHDVNAELVRAGAAWVYLKYTKDPKLLALESEARQARRGLWGQDGTKPVPPWTWRHTQHAEASEPPRCGAKRYCREMKSCAEARFYLEKCGVTSLDGNGDGRPCASLCPR